MDKFLDAITDSDILNLTVIYEDFCSVVFSATMNNCNVEVDDNHVILSDANALELRVPLSSSCRLNEEDFWELNNNGKKFYICVQSY